MWPLRLLRLLSFGSWVFLPILRISGQDARNPSRKSPDPVHVAQWIRRLYRGELRGLLRHFKIEALLVESSVHVLHFAVIRILRMVSYCSTDYENFTKWLVTIVIISSQTRRKQRCFVEHTYINVYNTGARIQACFRVNRKWANKEAKIPNTKPVLYFAPSPYTFCDILGVFGLF